MQLNGTVIKYGDNVDTDVIIPARYLNTIDKKELASHCMEDLDTTFTSRVKPGDIMVGGENFGCGSSRSQSKKAALLWSLPRALPASSTGTLSTSVWRSWSVRRLWTPSARATRWKQIWTTASFAMSPPARNSTWHRFRNLSRPLSQTAV